MANQPRKGRMRGGEPPTDLVLQGEEVHPEQALAELDAILDDAIAEKTAQELEAYPEQDARHLAELKAILDEEGSSYAA